MPRNPDTGVYTRIDNTFSDPAIGDIIDPADATAFWADLTDALNNIPISQIGAPIFYAPCVADGVTEDSTIIQETIDLAEAAGGGRVILPVGDILNNGGVTISASISLEGSPVQTWGATDSDPPASGTRMLQTSITNSCITIANSAEGAQVRNIGFVPEQPADAGFTTPDLYKACILNLSGGSKFESLVFSGCNIGIQFGQITPSIVGSGDCYVNNISGSAYTALIYIVYSGDYLYVNNIYFHKNVGTGTNQRAYIQANSFPILCEKSDSPFFANLGLFGCRTGFQTQSNAQGVCTNFRIQGIDVDSGIAGIDLSGSTCFGEVSNFSFAGNGGTGSYGVQAATGTKINITNMDARLVGTNVALALGTGDIAITNLRVNRSNQDNGGYAVLRPLDAASRIETSGRLERVVGSFPMVLFSGSGTWVHNGVPSTGTGDFEVIFKNSENLSANRTVTLVTGNTNVTVATLENIQTFTGAKAFSGGGVLDGTWSGNPEFSGAVFFGGAPRPLSNDVAALGTTALMWSDLFLASGGVVNFNNGDVTITHSANLLAFAGASSGYTFDAAVKPASNDGAALGTTALQFSDLFLAEGAVINWDSGDVTITQTGNVLSFAGATTRYEFDAALTPTSNDGGALGTTALMWSDLFLAAGGVINWNNGAATITYVSGSDEITFLGAQAYYFDARIAPFSPDGAALGGATLPFSDLFLADGGVLNFNNGNITLTHGTGTLTFAGGTFINAVDRGMRFNNQTSAAAASAGTLLNAPAAGNPGHWLKINIGGTNYAIPCWAG